MSMWGWGFWGLAVTVTWGGATGIERVGTRDSRQPYKEGRFYLLHDMGENLFIISRAKNLTPLYT